MAMFQPFKGATQRKGSAVNDVMVEAQMEAARQEMISQKLAGAAQIGMWGLGKNTSPWADSLYGGAESAMPTGVNAGPVIDPSVLAARNAEAMALRTPEIQDATAPSMSAMDLAMGTPQSNPNAELAGAGARVGMGAMMGGPMGAGAAALPYLFEMFG